MGYGRQSRQNRKENPIRNWTLRLHKMQKNLPHHPKQKEDLRQAETDSTSTPSLFSIILAKYTLLAATETLLQLPPNC